MLFTKQSIKANSKESLQSHRMKPPYASPHLILCPKQFLLIFSKLMIPLKDQSKMKKSYKFTVSFIKASRNFKKSIETSTSFQKEITSIQLCLGKQKQLLSYSFFLRLQQLLSAASSNYTLLNGYFRVVLLLCPRNRHPLCDLYNFKYFFPYQNDKRAKVNLYLFIRYYMKLRKQISFGENQSYPQNQEIPKLKQPTKSMNFGKSIKMKAHMLHEKRDIKEHINGVMVNIRQEQITPIQMKKRESFDDSISDMSFRSKLVRFEDQQNQSDLSSLQNSRNKRKTHSILKKSPSIDKQSVNSGNSDLGNSQLLMSRGTLKNQVSSNNQKYQKTVKALKYQNKKFFDNLFPPGSASLCYSKAKSNQLGSIRWARIQDVFRNKKLVLYRQDSDMKCIIKKGALNYFQNMVIAFNALSNSNISLHRIFQDQKIFGLCVYYLRLNHDGIWKYFLIDDYIPVIKTPQGQKPAFLNVQQNKRGQIEIWPFLIQKGLAKIYNCYQCLFQDTIQNLLFELSGCQMENLDLRKQSAEFKFRNSVLHSQTILLAKQPWNRNHFPCEAYALREEKESHISAYFSFDLHLRVIDNSNNQDFCTELSDLKIHFQKVAVIRFQEPFNSYSCIIKQIKNSFSIRKFKIKEKGSLCTLNLIQKDKKYYRNNGYDYVWGRLMIVTSQGQNGFRWIAGKYSKQRIVSISTILQPGQYYALISGDWDKRVYEMVLNYQGSEQIQFTRDTIQKNQSIISETCMDIAQRFGSFKQLTRNLCAYRIIDKANGFIIQNVNNEVNRQVFFHKLYPLPQKQSSNYELWNNKAYIEGEEGEIEILINPNSHFTFILKAINGFSNYFTNQFEF